MIFYRFFLVLLVLLLPLTATAGEFVYEYKGNVRLIGGYAESNPVQEHKYNFPLKGELFNSVEYKFDDETSLIMGATIKAQTGEYLENLNQGHWGEEVFGQFSSLYGDFYVGQMPNVAVELAVNRPNLPIWQLSSSELTDFIHNPNWQQKNSNKYYNTLNSTAINTDGSSLKLSYLTPEFANVTLGFSYVPENHAKDGLASKFSQYAHKSAYIATLYHHYEFSWVDTEMYLSYADYAKSHWEYAGGMSFYRKGWTMFGAYRQSQTTSSDYPITSVSSAYTLPAYYDGYRNSKAWNIGFAYEWALLTSIVDYFESTSEDTKARNRIIKWHNSIRYHKNFGFYLGAAYVDFKTNNDNIADSNNGAVFYGGLELTF